MSESQTNVPARGSKGTHDSERTRLRLIEAATEIVRSDGLSALGVNAVARKAGVSKVLIYRYFGSLEGLFRAAVEQLDLTKTGTVDLASLESTGAAGIGRAMAEGLRTLHDSLAADEFGLQLMADELTPGGALGAEIGALLADVRERQGTATTRRVTKLLSGIAGASPGNADMEALLAIASAAITYLTLRARSVSVYNGVRIDSATGWDRICTTLGRLVELALTHPPGSRGAPDS
jgi:AcrR family transcriptional regulator